MPWNKKKEDNFIMYGILSDTKGTGFKFY